MLQNSENKPRGFCVMFLGGLYLEGHIDEAFQGVVAVSQCRLL